MLTEPRSIKTRPRMDVLGRVIIDKNSPPLIKVMVLIMQFKAWYVVKVILYDTGITQRWLISDSFHTP